MGGRERKLDGSRGTQRPVGVPIVVKTESHPKSLRISTPRVVPEINPSTKYAVLCQRNYPWFIYPLREITRLCSAIDTISPTIPDFSRNGTPPSFAPMFPTAQRQLFSLTIT